MKVDFPYMTVKTKTKGWEGVVSRGIAAAAGSGSEKKGKGLFIHVNKHTIRHRSPPTAR